MARSLIRSAFNSGLLQEMKPDKPISHAWCLEALFPLPE